MSGFRKAFSGPPKPTQVSKKTYETCESYQTYDSYETYKHCSRVYRWLWERLKWLTRYRYMGPEDAASRV
ncbi:hypothetical protein DHEL01_v203542 [Diaporthe helianthi]|uniref:Uncharacterized protein n=1 Tax=Diaporthe helianthi TaxID=158607 RepID=A0A2P5I6C7_DIAHE|nr:hypothetical protein DHEL01_v203542 [Diaporthe helianthi]